MKKYIIVVVIILVLIAGIVCGWYFGRNQNTADIPNQNQN